MRQKQNRFFFFSLCVVKQKTKQNMRLLQQKSIICCITLWLEVGEKWAYAMKKIPTQHVPQLSTENSISQHHWRIVMPHNRMHIAQDEIVTQLSHSFVRKTAFIFIFIRVFASLWYYGSTISYSQSDSDRHIPNVWYENLCSWNDSTSWNREENFKWCRGRSTANINRFFRTQNYFQLKSR